MPKRLVRIWLWSMLVLVLIVASLPLWHQRCAGPLAPALMQRIERLGDSALRQGDVPVAAVLLYDGQVVADGFNAVVATGNIAAHAEIVAVNHFLARVGVDSFRKLDHQRLELISSWEPCPMCAAALAGQGILHVTVLRKKPLRLRWQQELARWQLLRKMRFLREDTLQLQLFRRHPDFRKQDTGLY